eukprot:270264-Chlamydomonas_euryale.AAC.1
MALHEIVAQSKEASESYARLESALRKLATLSQKPCQRRRGMPAPPHTLRPTLKWLHTFMRSATSSSPAAASPPSGWSSAMCCTGGCVVQVWITCG